MGCAGGKPVADKPDSSSPRATGDVKLTKAPSADAPSAEMLEKARALFKEWDVDSVGWIELALFKNGVTLKIGPHERHVLKVLSEMDADNDGNVTAQEWDHFFVSALSAMCSAEAELVLDELTAATEQMVTIVRCTKLAAMSVTAPTPAAGDESEPEPEPEPEQLPAARKESIAALFKVWDFDGTGGVDRDKVDGASLKLGPHEAKVFSSLAAMDTDGDNIVTFDEMTTFFTLLSPSVNDEEFALLVDEMMEVATNAATIFSLSAIAAAGAEQAAIAATREEGEEAPEVPALSEARAALVKALYAVFPASAKGIETAALQADSSFKLGPHSTNLLSSLESMDADADGAVTVDEMLSYFTAVGSELTDDEFGIVVSEMIDQANASAMTRMAGAL